MYSRVPHPCFLILALALLLTGCSPFGGQAPSRTVQTPTLLPATMTTSNPTIDQVEIDMLNNIKTNGFDNDPTINDGLGGLYINWRYGSSPLQTDVNGTGETDEVSGLAVRHDPLTDARYLHNLWSYKVQYPADTRFDDEIARYTPIIKHEFAETHNERGWLYDVFIDLYTLSHDSFYRDTALSLVEGYAKAFNPRVGSIFKVNKSSPRGSYRVDLTLESGCALVEAGTQFHHPQWVLDGMSTINFVYQHAYIAQYHTFPAQMDQVLLPSGSTNPRQTFYMGQAAKNGKAAPGQVRMGNISQIIIALLDAYRVTRNQDFLQKAIDLLDPFALPGNALGMWDTTAGGYFYAVNFWGSSPAQPGDMTVDRTRKEAGRQAIMLQAFHLADKLTHGKYQDMEARMLNVTLNHIYNPSIHGVPYLVNADWSFKRFANGTLNDMVTTEAMGAELESLFSLKR